MGRPLARRLSLAIAVPMALLGVGLGLSSAAPAQHELRATSGAWYLPDPTCVLPVGCLLSTLPLPSLSPYPKGTLHVGVVGGHIIAQAYLGFPLHGLGHLATAELSLPLDTSVTDGSIDPEAERIEVCPVDGTIKPVEGSFRSQPTYDCFDHATLRYVAEPQPHLIANLATMRADLSLAGGLALLAQPNGSAIVNAWQVAFADPSSARQAKALATLTVTVGATTPEPTRSTPPTRPSPSAASSVPASTLPLPSSGGASASPIPSSAGPPELASPTGASPVASAKSYGFFYPVILLLPLALCLVVPMAARALTRDLDAVEDVEV